MLQIDSAAYTNQGHNSQLNQNTIFHRVNQPGSSVSNGLFVVSAGLGEHQAGIIASKIAIKTITEALTAPLLLSDAQPKPLPETPTISLEDAIKAANVNIRRYAQENLSFGERMGATLTAALIQGEAVEFANIGNGRAYVWRDGTLTQITQDHSLAAKLAARGVIDRKDIPYHPYNSVVLRALGVTDEIEVDTFTWQYRPGDKLLLCSDGLWKAAGIDERLNRWLKADVSVTDLCRQLANQTRIRNSSDTIHTIVVRIDEVDEALTQDGCNVI
ncbi:MAG: protein phosphatase 2C domain-containing protein [Anaerolineae bacterium]|nr:protein phosphatase 2C domain-containing protein [Anaerolineae bacterium]